MIAFIIRTKIMKNNNFIYFIIKNIIIFYEKNNFVFDEDNTFIKKNIRTFIKKKKYKIILPISFSIFFLLF